MKKKEKNSQVRLELDGPLLEHFKIVKENYGVKRNTDVLRLLVNDKYQEMFGTKTEST
jgi:hypothetical protein